MPYSRRKFLGGTGRAAIAASAVIPPPLMTLVPNRAEPVSPIEDPRLKMLVDAGLSSALSSGASYADVRLTHTFLLSFTGGNILESESIMIGVRALVNGTWGFATSPIWSQDEASRLGRGASAQARAGSTGRARVMSLAPLQGIANGHWTMPVKHDPFKMDRGEIWDYLDGLRGFIRHMPHVSPTVGADATFLKQEKAFGSSDGAFCTQCTYRSEGAVVFVKRHEGKSLRIELDCLTPKGVGFELFRDQPLREICVLEGELALEDLRLPVGLADPGRFNVVMDAHAIATLISMTIGASTECDRALGYEANAGGTSYISDPASMIGEYKIGSPELHITGNRSEIGGVATVKWDDDGASPQPITLVDNGVLCGMQTNRETAAWLEANSSKVQPGLPSTGCASASDGGVSPVIQSGNLVLSPGKNNLDWEGLTASMGDGYALRFTNFDMDFQRMSGLGVTSQPTGRVIEIKKGKKNAILPSNGILFRTNELWNAIVEKGGNSQAFGIREIKGEPSQPYCHSVSASPILFKELTIIDVERKA